MSIVALVFLLLALLIVISALWPNWNFTGGVIITPNRVIGLIIALVVLSIVYLIVVALFGSAVTVHAAITTPLLLGFLLGAVNPSPPPSSSFGSYALAYKGAWAVAVIGVVAGVLAGYQHFAVPPPSWLTPDIAGTAAIVSAICVGLAALLPQLGRTPTTRAAAYLRAVAGILPKDLAQQHPLVTPPKPFDTLPPTP